MPPINILKGIDLNKTTDELMHQLAEKAQTNKYDIKYKWFHETAIVWEQDIQNSMLFDDAEMNRILPLWLEYFQKLLKTSNYVNLKDFAKYAEDDFKWRDELYENELSWDVLLIDRIELLSYDEYEPGADEEPSIYQGEELPENILEYENDESEFDVLSRSTNQANQSLFVKKLHFLLDLFLPSRFQYTVYKNIFKPESSKHKIPHKKKQLTMTYPLEFFSLPFFEEVSSKSKKGAKSKPREDTKKVQFLPLKKAIELDEYFFETLATKQVLNAIIVEQTT